MTELLTELRYKNCFKIKEQQGLKIVVWGCGKTGSSLVYFLAKQGHVISVIDRKRPSDELVKRVEQSEGSYFSEGKIAEAIEWCDFFIPSPGVRLGTWAKSPKHIPEFDLFSVFWKKKIVAITGSVGKTSTTFLIYQCLKKHFGNSRVSVAGNIGDPLFNRVDDQRVGDQENGAEVMVIEASNAQLEHTLVFDPDYAIITNLLHNHLDMHDSFEAYIRAKSRIFINNPKKTELIISEQAHGVYNEYGLKQIKKACVYSAEKRHREISYPIISYPINWVAIENLLWLMGLNNGEIETIFSADDFSVPEHRLECVGRCRATTFINDSKATVLESTYQAIETVRSNHPNCTIVLLLGGTSKGVDRVNILKSRPPNVACTVCFGAEAQSLVSVLYSSESCENMDKAFRVACSVANQLSKDQECVVLLSPGGASFDLFSDYQERGNYFKKLVSDYIQTSSTSGSISGTVAATSAIDIDTK